MQISGENPLSVTILGGSGFIGTRLVGTLLEENCLARIGDLLPSGRFPEQSIFCDVRNLESLASPLAGSDVVINLAAVHRDDVHPLSLYFETNVEGARNVCQAARIAGITRIIFTSSVAVYGFHSTPIDEYGPFEPFNLYGQTKLQAEAIYRSWAEEAPDRSLVILRPTVVFGEGNRGNVYNLIKQVACRRFIMIGDGKNRKSMAYVGNVARVLVHCLSFGAGIHIFNYADSPDLDMNELIDLVLHELGRSKVGLGPIPLPLAMAGAHLLDALARLTHKSFPVSAVRVRKFSENTQFRAGRILEAGFQPSYTLKEALQRTIREEFGHSRPKVGSPGF